VKLRRNGLTDTDKSTSLAFDTVPDAKPQSFAPAEMVTCDACLRANPPTRAKCLYCGASLSVTSSKALDAEASVKSTDFSRALSAENPTEVGSLNSCYLVLAPNQTDLSESSLAEISALLHLQITDVRRAVGLHSPIPLARATPKQVTILADKFRALGLGVNTFKEDTLNLDVPARKIRALEFSDEGLAAEFMSGTAVSVNWADLVLMVTGRLVTNRVEVEERRRRGGSQPLGSRELFSDEPVVDLYTKSDEVGYRISASSFDFSCLGPEKAMTAFENFARLIDVLRSRAPNVEQDDVYRRVRAVLANVWPLEPQTRKGEWRRSGAGKMDLSTVTSTNNEIQFNSYSRLRRRVKLHEGER